MSCPTIEQAKCVLVIGATSGIGRDLALAIHDLPSKPTVIVSGRRQDRLDELTARSDRIKSVKVDLLGGRESLKAWTNEVVAAYPDVSIIFVNSQNQLLNAIQ
jgi:short-subunit dehydrogenase involved in D-alanine esterification of teichoic acids